MLQQRAKAWTACRAVAGGAEAQRLYKAISTDALVHRLYRDFQPRAQTFLAEAGRAIERARQAKAPQNALEALGSMPLGVGAASASRKEYWPHLSVGVGAFGNNPVFRAIAEDAAKQERMRAKVKDHIEAERRLMTEAERLARRFGGIT